MGKKIFSASFPGIEVRVVEQKRLPDCRPEFRCFYTPPFRRITIRVLPNHLYAFEQIIYVDLVNPSDLWNVVVKESDEKQLQVCEPGEVITAITHYYEKRSGIDYDVISVTLRSLEGFLRSLLIRVEHDDKKVMIPINQ